MKIRNIFVEKIAMLAPMAGLCDRAFREICAEYGASYTVSEMVSSKGLCYSSDKTADLMELGDKPYRCPQAIQIFGDEPETMAKAARLALEYHPDVIDINMGCPAPKIAGNGSGSALMKNLSLANQIIKAVVNEVKPDGIPVTVKIRKGWDNNLINAVETAQMAEEAGADAITVHGRTRQQMYAPSADWDIIAQVKETVTVPVIGNGDVISAETAAEMYRHTNCDLVMIGRGALGAPWLFSQVAEYLRTGTVPPEPTPQEKMDILLRHIRLAVEYKGEYRALREARTHSGYYFHGWQNAAELRRRAGKLETLADLESLTDFALKEANNL